MLVAPEPLWIGPMCIWCFWLWISSRIKSWSTDFNSWDTLYLYITTFPDKEKSQKELVKTHEVFLKAMAYYKKKLHIRLRFEKGRLILLHFLNIRTPECNVCSLRLSHTDGKWSCKYYCQMPIKWKGEPGWHSRVTVLCTGWPGVWIQVRARDFCLLQKHPDWLWSPPGLLFSGYWGCFLGGVKWLGNEFLTTDVKN